MKRTLPLRINLAGVVSLVLAFTLLVTGTFAWIDYDRHQTNEFEIDTQYFSVTLNEDFEEVTSWHISAPQTNKDITVTNTGAADGTYGNVYVRLQLKEFMQQTPLQYQYTAQHYLMLPAGGEAAEFVQQANEALTSAGATADELILQGDEGYSNFVTLKTESAAQRLLNILQTDTRWKDSVGAVAEGVDGAVTAINDTAAMGTRYYIKTSADNQYAKPVPLATQQAGPVQVLTKRSGDAPALAVQNHHAGTKNCLEWQQETGESCPISVTQHEVGECGYLVHLWSEDDVGTCDLHSHDYVEWNLSATDVITLKTWRDNYNGMPVAKWIVDTESDAGWVYWGQPLPPGATTAKLLDSVTLLQQPEGEIYYALHTDMEAVDLGGLANWGDNAGTNKAPQDLLVALGAIEQMQINITPAITTVEKGKTYTFAADVTGTQNTDVMWKLTGGDTTSEITQEGVLTVSESETSGVPLTVTVVSAVGGKSASITLTIQ